MRLVDTHCHLQDPKFDDDRDALLANTLHHLAWIVVVGDTLASSRQAVELASDRVFATVGVHPHNAAEFGSATPDALRDLAAAPHVVALGEIGLDYYYDFSPRDTQRRAFVEQLILARDLGLPVVIHCRDAQDDLAAVLDGFDGPLPRGVMHCFAGGPDFAQRCLDWGFHISFAGNVTFKKAQELRDAALAVPMNRLLVETDSPYLAPVPKRGKRCEPCFVRHTAELVADLKNVPFDEFADQTTRNAERLFGVTSR
ncbi:MAG: TatD family hydrolase [bacterium]|nr:TatD family hydrolase [bacterium]